MPIVADAHKLAQEYLSDVLPNRWRHVQAVGQRASELGSSAHDDTDALVAAAWLHDIGYAAALVETGFHPLDGARFLRSHGVDDRVCRLVAHHTGARVEAELRGLGDVLVDEFEQEVSPCADLLWFCDLTTGPSGERVTVDDRLAEIRSRYGPGDVVTRFVEQASDELLAACGRAEAALRAAGMAV